MVEVYHVSLDVGEGGFLAEKETATGHTMLQRECPYGEGAVVVYAGVFLGGYFVYLHPVCHTLAEVLYLRT
jgi:hypothetical protein